MKDEFGEIVFPGSDRFCFLLDVFLMMFPNNQLDAMVTLTNINLRKEKYMSPTTMGEIVKFLGTIILMMRVKVKKRRNLWRTFSVSKYLPVYNFGKTGMSRHRKVGDCHSHPVTVQAPVC